MSIDIKRRTISEKNTSVEDPIEYSQKGIVSLKSTAAVLPIPTTIKDVKTLSIMPMNASAALAILGGSNAGNAKKTGWYSDLVKYTYNSVSNVLGHATSANAKISEGAIAVRTSTKVLYSAVRDIATAAAAIAAVGTDDSMWKRVEGFSSNANDTNYLKVVLRSASYAVTNCKFAYEVRGY